MRSLQPDATAVPEEVRPRGLECRIPPPVVDGLCAALMYGAARSTPASEWHLPVAWRITLALCAAACGMGMALSGLGMFRKLRTTPDPLHPERASRLAQDGVYRHTRNPMYLGMALVLLGWGCWLAHPLALLCVPLAMAYLQRFQIRPEERLLHSRFGEAYARYCRRVRRWL